MSNCYTLAIRTPISMHDWISSNNETLKRKYKEICWWDVVGKCRMVLHI